MIELALAGFILIENTVFTRELIPNGLFFLSFARSVAIAAFIALVVCQPDLIISRALNWRFAIMLGTFSYSIYVWQKLFTQPLEGDSSPFWLRFPGNLIASVVAGVTSYHVLEKHTLRFKEHFSRT